MDALTPISSLIDLDFHSDVPVCRCYPTFMNRIRGVGRTSSKPLFTRAGVREFILPVQPYPQGFFLPFNGPPPPRRATLPRAILPPLRHRSPDYSLMQHVKNSSSIWSLSHITRVRTLTARCGSRVGMGSSHQVEFARDSTVVC